MDTHETKVYIALLIVAGFLGILLVFFIYTILRHQRRNLSLHKEKINAEIITQEKERTRIASDLHDDLGPMLSSVKMRINNFDLQKEEDLDELGKVNSYIDGILLQIRTISNDLVPQALIRKGLVVAVNEFISVRNEKRVMQVSFHHDGEIDIPAAQGVHLYRIIHEVIHNADKHARADKLQIDLRRKNDQLILNLQDNGQGYDDKDPNVIQKGLGLKNITSRVETLKGNIFIQTAAGKGTGYTIEIPVES